MRDGATLTSRPGRGSRGARYAPTAGSRAPPQTPTLFCYIMFKTLYKTACKSRNCIAFMNQIYDYKNAGSAYYNHQIRMIETVFRDGPKGFFPHN